MLISCYCHTVSGALFIVFSICFLSVLAIKSIQWVFSFGYYTFQFPNFYLGLLYIFYFLADFLFCPFFLSVYYCFLDHSCNSCFCSLFQVIPTSLSYWHLLVIFSHTSWTFPVLFLFLIFVRQVVLDCFLVFWMWCMYFWALFKFYGKHCYYTFSS